MKNRREFLALITLFALFGFGCAQVAKRLQFEDTFTLVEEVRRAEFQHYRTTGRYGKLTELVGNGLVSDRLKDSHEHGYKFTLTLEDSGFQLTVRAMADKRSPTSDLSLYLDESGVIRGSLDPNKQADSSSEPFGDNDGYPK